MYRTSDNPCCPDCGGPVSATTPYCMHCGTDFGDKADETSRQSPSSSNEGPVEPDTRDIPDIESSDEDRLLTPVGLLDDALTLLVGVVGGALVGLLTLALFAFITQSSWSFVLGGLAWLIGTGYLANRPTIRESVKAGCYVVALLLVCFPLISFSDATKGGNFVGRVVLFFVGELLFGILGLGFAGVGYFVGSE